MQSTAWQVFADAATLHMQATNVILDSARAAITARSVFRLVLAGGRTPRDVYARLAQFPVEWKKWQIYFGDERCLPRGDQQRNDSMARAAWLDRIAIPAANIHSIPAELGPELGAQRYAEVLATVGSFDLVLLGLGEDGHTASLFPGQPLGDTANSAAVLAVHTAPQVLHERISLSIARLNRTRQAMFLITGEDKRAALAAWWSDADIPAAHVAAPQTLVWCDADAAGGLADVIK